MRLSRRFMVSAGIALTACAALAGTATAQNTTKTSSTNSCPSQQSVMTTTSSQGTDGYICAQEYHDGNWSVAPASTATFSQDTDVTYFPQYYCWDSSDDKEFTYSHAEIFGSGSVSATNFGTSTHIWGAGYLYTLGATSVSGWTNGCYDNSDVWQQKPQILTISSITAKNLPDNGAATAGKAYTVNVNVSPDYEAEGYPAVVQDNGASVASGTIDENGNATITWIPAIKGNRQIQVAWPGSSSALGNITDPYTVDVSGGTGMSITPGNFTANGSQITANVKVNIDTSPNPMPAQMPVLLFDTSTVNPSSTPPGVATQLTPSPVMATPTSSGATTGSVNISFAATAGKTYKLMAQVPNSASTQSNPLPPVGQSYVTPLQAPPASTISTTFPSSSTTIYVGSKPGYTGGCATVNLPTSVAPSNATGTVTASGTGSTSATLVNGSATPGWCPPSSAGSYTANVSYAGSNTAAPGTGNSGTIKVVTGGPSNVTFSYPIIKSTTSNTASFQTTVTTSGWTGSGTTQMINSTNGQVLGSGNMTGGSGLLNFTVTMWDYYNLVAVFSPNGVQNFPSPVQNNFIYYPPGALERKPRKSANELGAAREQARPGPGSRGGKARSPRQAQGVETGTRSFGKSRRITSRARSLTIKCPAGTYPLHAYGATGGPATQMGISTSGRSVKITSPQANVGYRMKAQAFCRQTNMKLMIVGYKAYGTRGPDVIRYGTANGLAFAGPGPDRVALSGAGSVAWGGQGADRMVVRGKDSVGDGGPGRDRIVAAGTARTLLVGGIGRDLLVGGTADTLINARDGKGGDRVICRSSANRVLLDAGDVTTGPCTVISTS